MKPRCEQCWPGMEHGNIEAWEVFQYASLDYMGISLQGILTACEILAVSDVNECVEKVKELVSEIRSLESKEEEHKRLTATKDIKRWQKQAP